MGHTETPCGDIAPSFTLPGLDVVCQYCPSRRVVTISCGLYFRVKHSMLPVEQAVWKQQTGDVASDGSTKF